MGLSSSALPKRLPSLQQGGPQPWPRIEKNNHNTLTMITLVWHQPASAPITQVCCVAAVNRPAAVNKNHTYAVSIVACHPVCKGVGGWVCGDTQHTCTSSPTLSPCWQYLSCTSTNPAYHTNGSLVLWPHTNHNQCTT